jgi:membrane protein DedA with SNARE-associated domain
MNEVIHFLMQHGPLILFAVVFAEQVGLPIPALPFLIAAGALVGADQMALDVTVGTAVLAAVAADVLWFELGRFRGPQILNWLRSSSPLNIDSFVRRTEEFFGRHGARSLVVAKFVPGLSTIAPPLAGTVGVSVSLFLWYDSLGTLLWVGSAIALGYAFSSELDQAVSLAVHVGPAFGLILLAGMIGYITYKALQRYQRAHLVAPNLRHRAVCSAPTLHPLVSRSEPARQIESGRPLVSVS